VLEDIATTAGLSPEQAFDTAWSFVFPDEDSLGNALLAPGALGGPGRRHVPDDRFRSGPTQRSSLAAGFRRAAAEAYALTYVEPGSAAYREVWLK
jgi:hypothetical protein